jgi:CRISPR-associated endonuclease/helicase Cas3
VADVEQADGIDHGGDKLSFNEFFKKATGHDRFPYQAALAEASAWPSLVSVPTGLGKTAAVILGWLWRRRFATTELRHQTPRRLVYCLPMRVLVEQTYGCAVAWLEALDLLGGKRDGDGIYDPWAGPDAPSQIRVHMLMGGDVDRDWDRYPERDAILIGTQDMLLSRALNRGYAMSRFRWPVQFALLNNDSVWIMDEVQLMGTGLATSTQLQAFRRKLGTAGRVRSTWMSATMRPDWLATVDFDHTQDAPGLLEITEEDKQHPVLKPRFDAVKRLEKAAFESSPQGAEEARLVLDRHTPGSRSIVVVNTVKRAQAVFEAIRKREPKADIFLVHSRFRPDDRATQLAGLLAEPGPEGTIGICTQVVEAGVDVSARLLVTDLAPWASLVQRFGRCNRKGEFNDDDGATVIWISPPHLSDDKLKPEPYDADELRSSAERLATMTDVGPSALPSLDHSNISVTHVIRRKDLVDLFDNTADLAGADIDVSRFIRESDDHEVRVFWRDLGANDSPAPESPGPARAELCAVPVRDLRDWLDKGSRSAWRFDHLAGQWKKPNSIYPGLVLMMRSADGGYSSEVGWTGKEKHTEPVAVESDRPEGDQQDRLAEDRQWATIARHTEDVVVVTKHMIETTAPAVDRWKEDLLLAARWHDAGKAHQVFQQAVPETAPGPGPWAKTPGQMRRYGRPGFRHELASAIAMLLAGHGDLAAYIAAAHHGKVRLSIRSLPHEEASPNKRFARGVWDGDTLPSTDLGGGVVSPEATVDLSFMELGDGPHGPSWLARMLTLRDDPELGPFRLAFLEALLRVSDWRASNQEVGS